MGGYPGLRREWWNCSDLHTEAVKYRRKLGYISGNGCG